MIYPDDNASEALEKIAIFGSFKRTAPVVSADGRQAIIRSARKGDKDALAMAKRLGIKIEETVGTTGPKFYGINTTRGARQASGGGWQKIAAEQIEHKPTINVNVKRSSPKRDIRSALMAGAGAYGGVSAAQAIAKRRLKLPGTMAVAIPSALLASEAYRSYRSGARRREIQRRGVEAQEYLRQAKRVNRAMPSGATKTANAQMVKMYLQQGLDPAAAVKKAYPHWSAQRRREVVRQIMER